MYRCCSGLKMEGHTQAKVGSLAAVEGEWRYSSLQTPSFMQSRSIKSAHRIRLELAIILGLG